MASIKRPARAPTPAPMMANISLLSITLIVEGIVTAGRPPGRGRRAPFGEIGIISANLTGVGAYSVPRAQFDEFVAGHPLWRAHAAQNAGVCDYRRADLVAGDWGDDGDLQRGGCPALEAHRFAAPGNSRDGIAARTGERQRLEQHHAARPGGNPAGKRIAGKSGHMAGRHGEYCRRRRRARACHTDAGEREFLYDFRRATGPRTRISGRRRPAGTGARGGAERPVVAPPLCLRPRYRGQEHPPGRPELSGYGRDAGELRFPHGHGALDSPRVHAGTARQPARSAVGGRCPAQAGTNVGTGGGGTGLARCSAGEILSGYEQGTPLHDMARAPLHGGFRNRAVLRDVAVLGNLCAVDCVRECGQSAIRSRDQPLARSGGADGAGCVARASGGATGDRECPALGGGRSLRTADRVVGNRHDARRHAGRDSNATFWGGRVFHWMAEHWALRCWPR